MNWNSITIKKWKEIKDILSDNMDDIDKNINIMAIVYDITPEEVYNMPLLEFSKMAKDLEWLRTPPEAEMVSDRYKINGTTYKMCLNPGEITTAQYIDFKNLYIDKDNHIAEILAVFLIPEGKTYNDGYDISQVEKDIYEHLPITYALGMSAFFLTLLEVWREVLATYSKTLIKKEMRKEKDKTKKKALTDMLGLLSWMEYQK